VNLYVDYNFQHHYRSKDISFYFKKEFLMAVILLAIYQLSLDDYKSGFQGILLYFIPEMTDAEDPQPGDPETVPTGNWIIDVE